MDATGKKSRVSWGLARAHRYDRTRRSSSIAFNVNSIQKTQPSSSPVDNSNDDLPRAIFHRAHRNRLSCTVLPPSMTHLTHRIPLLHAISRQVLSNALFQIYQTRSFELSANSHRARQNESTVKKNGICLKKKKRSNRYLLISTDLKPR